MELSFIISAFVTLFVIIDPIGLTPLFVALTDGMTEKKRRDTGRRALLIAAVLLSLFALMGDSILLGIGISLPAFRIAGGVLLFLTAMDMLFERRTRRREDTAEEDHDDDPSVFPMATPLLAGPGSLTTIVLLTGDADAVRVATVIGVMLAVLGTCALLFAISMPLADRLGPVGIKVITRILGMLLAALSVQFMLDGLASAGIGHPLLEGITG